jgi:hypothetical protein
MKQVTYAGSFFHTGTDIAEALVRLTAALGTTKATTALSIPAYDLEWNRTTVDLVIGPASEIFAFEIEAEQEELVFPAVVDAIEDAIRHLQPPHAVASDEPAETIAYPDLV